MKSNLIALTIVFNSLLISSHGLAAIKPGDGGDAVICKNGPSEVLEYYQARLLQNNPPDFGSASTYQEMVQVLISRLNVHFPIEANIARKALHDLENDSIFVQGSDLIGESHYSGVPLKNGCSFKKVLIENKKVFPEDKSYFIQQDYWKKLSEESKAGLIFQTLLLKTVTREKMDSVNSYRAINSALAGRKSYPNLRTPKDWAELIFPKNTERELRYYLSMAYYKVAHYLYDGVYHLRYDTTYSPDGQFKNPERATIY